MKQLGARPIPCFLPTVASGALRWSEHGLAQQYGRALTCGGQLALYPRVGEQQASLQRTPGLQSLK